MGSSCFFLFWNGCLAWLTILFLIPESPKWHMMNNRDEEAIKNLNQMVEMNGVVERIEITTSFLEMQINKNHPIVEEDYISCHTYVTSVADLALNAVAFTI